MENKYEMTPQTLADYFEESIAKKDIKNIPLKYIIYVRKSTDEEGKQVRSIEDQKKECLDFAKRNNLNYVDILEERSSAKESGKRGIFRKMLDDIYLGKYNGIISWHPDRLSRNMKEAGEIIEMINKYTILDLKFVSFTFNNDPSGKLLLGITFAMAQEYTDKLSIDVKRGNDRSLEEGKYPNKAKNGYYKDEQGRMRPDGANFNIIKEAFKMRLSGETQENIAEYINNQSKISTDKSISQKKLPPHRKQEVGEILSDPVYAGVIIYGNNVYNLTNIYDFKPMITAEEYIILNKNVKTGRVGKMLNYIKRKGVKADLMRGCIICAECNNSMTSGITPHSKTKINYFYYRCDTLGCKNKGKHNQTRAKVVINYASEYIKNNFIYTEKTWKHYQEEMQKIYKSSVKHVEEETSRLYATRKGILERQEKIKDRLLDKHINESLILDFQRDFETLTNDVKEIEEKIERNNLLKGKKYQIETKQEFIELMNKLPDIITSKQEMKTLDQIMRKIFLNFVINDKKIVGIRVKPPFDTLFDTKVSFGARERT